MINKTKKQIEQALRESIDRMQNNPCWNCVYASEGFCNLSVDDPYNDCPIHAELRHRLEAVCNIPNYGTLLTAELPEFLADVKQTAQKVLDSFSSEELVLVSSDIKYLPNQADLLVVKFRYGRVDFRGEYALEEQTADKKLFAHIIALEMCSYLIGTLYSNN